MDIRMPYRWRPHHHQLQLWRYMSGGGKRALAIWHRRAGKDDVGLHWTATAAMSDKVATYWYLLPMQRQARRVIWEAVNPGTGLKRIDEAFPPEIVARKHEQEMSLELVTGSMVHLLGSDNYDSLVGSPPYGVVFSEYALAKPSAWGFIRPILRQNGGWAMFLTTPRGKNHAYDMQLAAAKRSRWYCETITALETNVFTQEQLDDEFAEYIDEFGIEDGTALFEQEYLCSFESAVRGSYWGAEMLKAERDDRVVEGLKPLPGLPVHTAWDIGVDNATAIWFFQVTPNAIIWLNYYEQVGMGMEHFAAKKWELGAKFGYNYEGSIDWVPHDAKQRVWTKTNADGTARQRIEDMREQKLNPQLVPNHARADGINAGRKTIGRSYFNKENTVDGRECVKNYQRLWDADKKVYAKTPFHNWAVNGADAFRYGSMAWRITTKPPRQERGRPVVSVDAVGNMRTGLTFTQLRDRSAGRPVKAVPQTSLSFDAMRNKYARRRKNAG